jgi:hypothetical protein
MYGGKERCTQGFGGGWENLDNLNLEGRVILKWFFKWWGEEVWSGLLWPRIGTGFGRF